MRIAREEVEVVVDVIRVCQIAPRWGRRNRGIEVGGGILDWRGEKEMGTEPEVACRMLEELDQIYPSSPSEIGRAHV